MEFFHETYRAYTFLFFTPFSFLQTKDENHVPTFSSKESERDNRESKTSATKCPSSIGDFAKQIPLHDQ